MKKLLALIKRMWYNKNMEKKFHEYIEKAKDIAGINCYRLDNDNVKVNGEPIDPEKLVGAVRLDLGDPTLRGPLCSLFEFREDHILLGIELKTPVPLAYDLILLAAEVFGTKHVKKAYFYEDAQGIIHQGEQAVEAHASDKFTEVMRELSDHIGGESPNMDPFSPTYKKPTRWN